MKVRTDSAVKKAQAPSYRSCRSCRDFRDGWPEAPGYVGCSWCRTPVRVGVEMPITRWVGAVRCVRADQADIERGCSEWREVCGPSGRGQSASRARTAQAGVG